MPALGRVTRSQAIGPCGASTAPTWGWGSRMFDHVHLKTILAVKREGSYEAAARRLNVTSAAVSRRMRTLEDRAGVVLLDRHGKATPTELGLMFCSYAEAMELHERNILRAFSVQLANGCASAPKLRVIVNHDSLSTWFLDVLEADARSDDPQLFEIAICDQDHALEAMQSDAVLTAISSASEPLHGHNARFLGTHTYRAVATHAFVRRWLPDGPTRDAFIAAPSITYGVRHALPERWLSRVLDDPPRVPTHIVPCSQSSALACRRGAGWALMPSQIADPLLRSNELVEIVPGTGLDCPLYWHFSALAAEAVRPVTRLVMEAAVRHLGQSER